MAFFDRKEEVIDLQLTQFGKHILSKGAFKPEYYAFFDDDIIYDGQYAGVKEDQGDIQDRIEETLRTKTQYVFEGIETTINHNNKLVRDTMPLTDQYFTAIQPTATKDYTLPYALGKSEYSTEKLPAWNLTALIGHISSSFTELPPSEANIPLYNYKMDMLKIPQIQTEVNYKIAIEQGNVFTTVNDADGGDFPQDSILEQFEDGTRFIVEEDTVIFEIKEENTDFMNYNFDIEVYEIANKTDPAGNKLEILIPLSFLKKPGTNIVNNLLIDEPPIPMNESAFAAENPDLDSSYVEHWFNIWVDKEINPEELCSVIDVKNDINTQLLDTYECPDKIAELSKTPINIYSSPEGVAEEDIEDC